MFSQRGQLAGKGALSLHLAVFAKVAELVDALDLGSSAYGVGVRVPPFAPLILGRMTANTLNLSLIPQVILTAMFINHPVFRGFGRLTTWHEY